MESGEPRSTVFLIQAIGMAVQRGNAASVLGTVCNGRRYIALLFTCFQTLHFRKKIGHTKNFEIRQGLGGPGGLYINHCVNKQK